MNNDSVTLQREGIIQIQSETQQQDTNSQAMESQQREKKLDAWLSKIFSKADIDTDIAINTDTDNSRVSSLFPHTYAKLSGDASFRQYYRLLKGDHSFVVMDAPPPENPGLFSQIADLLRQHNLSTPQILNSDLEQGFLLLSDFGDRLYLNELNTETAPFLYQAAFEALIKIQSIKTTVLPTFERAFLKRQMDIFKNWFLEKILNLKEDSVDSVDSGNSEGSKGFEGSHKFLHTDAVLNQLTDFFSDLIQEQPFVFVHRDYHSRNLMILKEGNPGILDFQDAMLGPITYDLVSLLQDCYIAWPRAEVEAWVLAYQQQAVSKGLLNDSVSSATFLQWFDLTGLQRHLKNLGIFSRLCFRDGKKHYLKDIPLVFHYIQSTFERYQQTALFPFTDFFAFLLTHQTRVFNLCAP